MHTKMYKDSLETVKKEFSCLVGKVDRNSYSTAERLVAFRTINPQMLWRMSQTTRTRIRGSTGRVTKKYVSDSD